MRCMRILWCVICASLMILALGQEKGSQGIAQTTPFDTVPPDSGGDSIPGDTIPGDTIPWDSFPPGSSVIFQSRIAEIDYASGILTFQSNWWIGKTTPATAYVGELPDTANLQFFAPDQLVLVIGQVLVRDTIVIDSLSTVDFTPGDSTYTPQQLVIQLAPGATYASFGISQPIALLDSIPELGLYLVLAFQNFAMDSLAFEYLDNSLVQEVDPNYFVSAPEGVQSSQPFIDLQARGDFDGQPAVQLTNFGTVHSQTTGSGVKVGIVDGGIDLSHPLFAGKSISGVDYLDGDMVPLDVPGGPGFGHGTFVSGLIQLAAPNAELRMYRVLDSVGKGQGFDVAKAIVRAVEDGCRVVNLSLVVHRPHIAIEQAVDYAWRHDATVVAAAGNDSSNVALYPAADDQVIAVAALDTTEEKSWWSNYGPHIDICAPGQWIYAPFPEGRYAWWEGTSFAAPFVSGQAALLYSKYPQSGVADIHRAIHATGRSMDGANPSYVGYLGAGMADLQASVAQFPQSPCGDVDGNGFGPDLGDLSTLIAFFSRTAPPAARADLANIDGSPDGVIDLGDLSALVSYLSIGKPVPLCR